MPVQFLPNKSSAHRIACFALYRALLEQCPRIQLPPELQQGRIHPIKHLIRKQFRRNVSDNSPRLVVAALKIGYKSEELLRYAGDGNPAAQSQILTLLKTLRHNGYMDHIRVSLRPPPPKSVRPRPEPYPGTKPVLETRPLPAGKLTGRRHVPILVNANGIGFLRFKKPQSPYLTRIIRNKIIQRQKRNDQIRQTESDVEFAKEEEEWESIVKGEMEREGLERETVREWEMGGHWAKDLWRANEQVYRRVHEEHERAKEKAVRMLGIVDEERRLWEEERRQRKLEKNKVRRERKEKREGADEGDRKDSVIP